MQNKNTTAHFAHLLPTIYYTPVFFASQKSLCTSGHLGQAGPRPRPSSRLTAHGSFVNFGCPWMIAGYSTMVVKVTLVTLNTFSFTLDPAGPANTNTSIAPKTKAKESVLS